ncbi:MAG: WG repeat-containing protein [Pseudomonas farsensis]|uniref:WG repeat-containing protein n=1 Tax=Pseudomonas farsensis TaxID=2745492 RepID=UPI003C7DA7BF
MKLLSSAPRVALFSALTAVLAGCGQTSAVKTPAIAQMTIPLCVNEQCAVLDQTGALRVGPDNDYAQIYTQPFTNAFIFARGDYWNLASGDGKQVLRADLTDEVFTLTPGLFGFVRDGKVGVMDEQGKEIQPAIYDNVFVGGNDQFIVAEAGELRGFLTPTGEKISEPVFDSMYVRDDFAKRGNWVLAERDGQSWGYNLQTKVLRKLDFDTIVSAADGQLVVSREGTAGKGLANAAGDVVIALGKDWLGTPGGGLVAFRDGYDQPCGYLDYQGKVVIAAQYQSCESFGKAGGMVQLPRTEQDRGKAGMIDRSGKWLIEPEYDSVGDAGLGLMGMSGHRDGFNHIGKLQNAFLATYGVVDLDQGKVVLAPTYQQVGVLTAKRFAFTELKSPRKTVSMMGMPTETATVGLMDEQGKVLIKPEQFIGLTLLPDGEHLLASEGSTSDAPRALYNLDGKLLVPAKWQDVQVDTARGAIFGYRVEGNGDDAVRTLRALYRLDGSVVFDTNTLPCGAEQVVDGKGQVLWPKDAQAHCPAPEPVAAAS